MKILWFTWKDKKHPQAGGAELVNEELAKRLVVDGHEVIFIVAGFKGGAVEEMINGYKIIRLGNRWTVYWQAYRYYKRQLVGYADLVIDEMNTIPFFCKFYVKERNILFTYQLCRKIWFYQISFPLSLLGYILEPFYLHFLRDRMVITESESTKIDLQRFGFKKEKIFVFPISLSQEPISEELFSEEKKEDAPTILYFGSLRAMKRPDHVWQAFKLAKKEIPNLRLWVAGAGICNYARQFLKKLERSKYHDDIRYFGRINEREKLSLMRRAHLVAVTSVKEGWGIVITEANSQGTPAVVYDVDGLRDACKNGKTGSVIKASPHYLSNAIMQLLGNKTLYESYRLCAWKDSFFYNKETSYKHFINIIHKF